MKKYFAEMIGTMILVLMGCGSAVFAGAIQPFASVGTLGVAFAFGLSVLVMCYTIGKISGCHINPAITLGVWLSKRMSSKDAGMYMIFQVIGGIIGSSILYFLARDSGSDRGQRIYQCNHGFYCRIRIHVYLCTGGVRFHVKRS